MRNNILINILLIVIALLVLVACVVGYMYFTTDEGSDEINIENAEYSTEKIFTNDNYPKVDGSIVTLPLAQAFKSNYTETDINSVNIKHTGTHKSFIELLKGNVDLVLVTDISKEDKKLAEKNNIEIEIVPIVKEPFVFFVNKENPVNNLTLEQIQKIYSGEITNWKDVDGEDNNILAYQRPENSSSQIAMNELIMNGKKMMKPFTETVEQKRADIIDVIPDYSNQKEAIGYAHYHFYKSLYTEDTMKILSIDNISPTEDNIQNGAYKLQSSYYAVIRKNESQNSNTRKLLNAMKSTRGQNIAKEAGYVKNY